MRWTLLVVVAVAALVLAVAFMNREPEPDRDPNRQTAAELAGKGEVPAKTQAASVESGAVRSAANARVRPDLVEGTGPGAESDSDAQHEEMVELARMMMSSSLEEFFPNLNPSEDDLASLATATVRLREAQMRLAQLEAGPGNDELRQRLSDEVEAAAEEFAGLMNMSMNNFGLVGGDDEFDDFYRFADSFDRFDDEELREASE